MLGIGVVVVVLLVAVWLAAPPVASGLVGAAATAAGLNTATTRAQVQADPPLTLLWGHADLVRVESSADSVRGVRIDRLDVALRNVSLFSRTAQSVDGSLVGVTASSGNGEVHLAQISVSGTPGSAGMTASLAAGDVARALASALEGSGGATVTDVRTAAPNGIRASLGGRTASFTLAVAADGSLVAATADGPTAPLVLWQPSAELPLRLDSVRVIGTDVIVSGTLDAAALLGLSGA